ncbi:Fip1 motif-domain-containing protein [Aspergillus pseudoustus]|uniref:Fip1 motif-domain-containing protein n=1 Tax=Aspergillus pseudoustus TaxID=1810923 RepID=A0ABR4KB79_9EURO
MSYAMDDDDDDLYDPADAVPVTQHSRDPRRPQAEASMNDASDAEEEEEMEEEEDEDDFNIITEAPPDAPAPDVSHPRHTSLRAESSQRPTSADSSSIQKQQTPSSTQKVDTSTSIPSGTRPTSQKPGSAYPAVHVSSIDVHANPVHPTTGKPIMLTDMDTDFPEDDKPWRRPGSDLTDYFNYGFDEFTWASYVLKQQELRKEVGDQKRQLDDMQSFLTMGLPPMPGANPGAGPPAGSAPPAMPGMPGMPDMNPEMMQGMLASMMAQGLDPASMDPMAFMQQAQAMMGGQSGPGGGQQGQHGFGGQGGGNQGQMGYGGGYGGGRGRGRRW